MSTDHEWWRTLTDIIYCRRCGMVQRLDGFQKPCTGVLPRITTRLQADTKEYDESKDKG